MCSLRTVLVVAALAWTCGSSQAGITYVAQSRGVSVLAVPSSDGASANDFGDFHASVSVQSIYGTGASASHSSALGGEGMFSQGACSSYGGMQFYSASGSSGFDVTFTLDDARPYRFWGGVSLDAREATARCEVSLLGPGGLIYENLAAANWDLNGIAGPGQYRLLMRVTTSASGGPVSSAGSYYGGFVVPSPAAAGLLAGFGALGLRRRR